MDHSIDGLPGRLARIAGLALLLALASQGARADICRVTTSGSGGSDGAAWSASMDLQTALGTSACDEIWVAAGVYFPTEGADREAAFEINRPLFLYGGFAGDEGRREERDADANLTVLSGDIDGNDLTDDAGISREALDVLGDNSFNVVRIGGDELGNGNGNYTPENTVIDGFTLTGGSSWDLEGGPLVVGFFGGGLFCNGAGAGNECSPALRGLTFAGNRVLIDGGALYASGEVNGTSNPELFDVNFEYNLAGNNGGAMLSAASHSDGVANARLHTVRFTGNRARVNGAGMFNQAVGFPADPNSAGGTVSPVLTDVYFFQNIAHQHGGAIFNAAQGENSTSSPVLNDVDFVENRADTDRGGAIHSYADAGAESSPRLTQVRFLRNEAEIGGGGMTTSAEGGTSSPVLRQVFFGENHTDNYFGGAMEIRSTAGATVSPDLEAVAFIGNNTRYQANIGGGGAIYNTNSQDAVLRLLITNATFSGNTTYTNGGALYNQIRGEAEIVLTNTTMVGNGTTIERESIFDSNLDGPRGAIHTEASDLSPAAGGLRLENTIVWDNGRDPVVSEGITPVISHSILENAFDAGGAWDGPGTDAGGNLDADPRLGSLADNGGDTETMLPGDTSPAIDAGEDSVCPDSDQRGVARPQAGFRGGPLACDIGAVEFIGDVVTLAVAATGRGEVSAEAEPAPRKNGIEACAEGGGVCSAGYQEGATVTLSTTAPSGWFLESWSGDCPGSAATTTLTLDDDAQCTAHFGSDHSTIGTAVTGSGTLTPVSQIADYDEVIQVAVEPAAGWILESISGCGGSLYRDTYELAPASGDCTVSAAFVPEPEPVVCRVTPDGDPGGDGSSWATATTLEIALGDGDPGENCTEIWAAEGLYRPVAPAGATPTEAERETAFVINRPLKIFGGFAGDESQRSARDPASRRTVLSGDLLGDDSDIADSDHIDTGVSEHNADNSRNVVVIGGRGGTGNGRYTRRNTLLDGLVITGGNTGEHGGGLFCNGRGAAAECSPSIVDVIFSGNHAALEGGAFFGQSENGGLTSPHFNRVTFRGNTAFNGNTGLGGPHSSGGALAIKGDGRHPLLTNVTMVDNFSKFGGAVSVTSDSSDSSAGSLTLRNVAFYGNRAWLFGGAMYVDTLEVSLANAVLWGNTTEVPDGDAVYVLGSLAIDYSIIQGGDGSIGNGASTPFADGDGNLEADPRLGTLAHNGGATWTLLLAADSPAIDAGRCRGAAFPLIPRDDQHGGSRPQDGDNDGGAACDIGPVEVRGENPVDVYALEVAASGEGQVSAGASPTPLAGGIEDCGAEGGNCFADYPSGALVSLDAVAEPGWKLARWSGSCHENCDGSATVRLNANATCAAEFVVEEFRIATGVQPASAGTVSCSSNPVVSGEDSTCTASPATGYSFSHFSGDCAGALCEFSGMAEHQSIVAHFTENTYTVGGEVSGYSGDGLVLALETLPETPSAPVAVAAATDADPAPAAVSAGAAPVQELAIDSNGPFVFPMPLAHGTSYQVSIAAQAGGCALSNGSGTAGSGQTGAMQVSCVALPVTGPASGSIPIPALSPRLLALLALMVSLVGLAGLRRRDRAHAGG